MILSKIILSAMLAGTLGTAYTAKGQTLPAFPGAEGFGMYTAGGRGEKFITSQPLKTMAKPLLKVLCVGPMPKRARVSSYLMFRELSF